MPPPVCGEVGTWKVPPGTRRVWEDGNKRALRGVGSVGNLDGESHARQRSDLHLTLSTPPPLE